MRNTPDVPPRSGGGNLPFEKLDGAGNDFVLFRGPLTVPTAAGIRFLLDRHHGVGADGLLHLTAEPDLGVETSAAMSARAGADLGAARELDATVRYWNSDGGSAEYCGNGARCIAAVLLEGRAQGAEVRFRLSDVVVRARRMSGSPDHYAVAHPSPRRVSCPPEIEELTRDLGLLHPPVAYDSGVPHLILEVEDARVFDLARWAPPLRHHPAWGGAGSNVDVVSTDPEGGLQVRTWERGVEGETLACGSGLLAVGEWVRTRSGDAAVVSLQSASGARFRVWPEDGAVCLRFLSAVVDPRDDEAGGTECCGQGS